jgi:hypothetical protein
MGICGCSKLPLLPVLSITKQNKLVLDIKKHTSNNIDLVVDCLRKNKHITSHINYVVKNDHVSKLICSFYCDQIYICQDDIDVALVLTHFQIYNREYMYLIRPLLHNLNRSRFEKIVRILLNLSKIPNSKKKNLLGKRQPDIKILPYHWTEDFPYACLFQVGESIGDSNLYLKELRKVFATLNRHDDIKVEIAPVDPGWTSIPGYCWYCSRMITISSDYVKCEHCFYERKIYKNN